MIDKIYQFGDQSKLNIKLNIDNLLEELEPFEDQWSQYNNFKKINREGLCVINERGKVGPGPALESIREYNKKYNTKYTEFDFNKPTELYHSSLELQKAFRDILPYCYRTHFLKIKSGGFFPPHRDHLKGDQTIFRIIVPISRYNPPSMKFMIEDRTLYWDRGFMYIVNTTKEHCLFNMNDNDSIWLVSSVLANERTVNFVIDNLAVK